MKKGYLFILGTLAVIIFSLIILNVFFQRTLQMEMAEQFSKQQLLLANAEASNIQAYFAGIKEEILHIAQVLSLFRDYREKDLTVLTNTFFKDAGKVKKRIEIIDSQGKTLFTRGDLAGGGPDTRGLTERAKKYCPGEVLLIKQDTKRASIVAPVCSPGSALGAIVISVDIQDIAGAFLRPIKSGSRGYAWMMDGKGDLLYHPTQPDMVGRNLYKTDASCFRCHKGFDAEKRIIEGRTDSYGRYVAPTGEDKVLAYSTALFGDSRWIVAVSAPYSEVTMSVSRSMRFYSWLIILIFVTTSVIGAMTVVLNRKREKAEERVRYQMMQSEKLASLERLTSGIASEIGNPLTSVFSFVEMLSGMEQDEFKKETLDTIYFHMNRIDDIMKRLSSFSHMPPLELGPCRVNSIIEDALSLIRYDKRVQDITIVRDLSPDLPEITTDGNRLSQVIVNIVLNAADAMPNGGTLTIQSRLSDKSVAITFEDTGVGIDREDLHRIFDPFYTTKETGTGLGLAVSHTIMEKLHGNLTVESEPNKGSRFTITLSVNGARKKAE